jgi:carboxyl-terminal processing protease
MRRTGNFGWLIILLLACWMGTLWSGQAPAEPSKPAKAEAAKPVQAKDTEDDYELQRILVDTIDQVQRNYVREVPRRKLIQAAIKGILSELDPYSAYIAPEEMERFRNALESEFGGIGIQISFDAGRLKVLSPMVGTPAYRAGLMAGDTITEIDGKSTTDFTVEDAVRRVKGKPGTQVTLTVVHPGSTDKNKVTITREIIHVDTVLGDRRKNDDRWDFMLDPQKKIGYVRLTAFSRETGAELRRALESLKQQSLRGLILDLRFNPGGLLSSAVEVSNLFISKGRIVSTAGRNSPERVWDAHKDGAYEGFPMVILVNRFSASASEIVSACLQDHKRAVIVGERTWGKGSVQNVIPLDDRANGVENGSAMEESGPKSALKLTIAGYRRPSGKNIDRHPGAKEGETWGVSPDPGLEVKLSDEDNAALMVDRRQRDILAPKKPGAAASPPKSEPAKPEPAKPEAKKPDVKAPDAKNPEAKKPEPAKPSPGQPAAPTKPEVHPTPAAGAKPVVSPADRQLQRAYDFLNTELARAK